MRRAILVLALLLPLPVAAQQAPPRGPADFVELSKPLVPAVVNISTERALARVQPPGLGPEARPDAPPMRRGTALGSGFIIDPTGYIVTNNHVVENATTVSVTLHDERRFEAKVVGTDPRTDIALLKIEHTEPLPHVRWGDSEQVQVGQWVLAIGNPFGLGGTVTSGIISATARNIGQGPYDAFLQTDAPINQGNSGGPMFDMNGGVIGVNTAIFSPTGGNIGIGFAVPSSLVRPVVEQLRETGTVRRGWLGVQIQTVNPDIAQALGMDQPQGALVSDVVAGGPAAAGGIRVGDVILRYNDRVLDEAQRLPLLVAETGIGSQAKLTILRDGKQRELTVTIAELPDEDRPPTLAQGDTGELGLALGPLTDPIRAQMGLAPGTTGAVVKAVRQGSPAAERGMRPGDVITMVAQQPVKGPEDVRSRIAEAIKAGRPNLLLLVRRGETQQFLTLPLPEKKK